MADNKPKKTYKVRLEANEEVFASDGETMLEAIKRLKYPSIKTKGVLNVARGSLKTRRIMQPFQLRRLAANDVYKVVLSKNLEVFLK